MSASKYNVCVNSMCESSHNFAFQCSIPFTMWFDKCCVSFSVQYSGMNCISNQFNSLICYICCISHINIDACRTSPSFFMHRRQPKRNHFILHEL